MHNRNTIDIIHVFIIRSCIARTTWRQENRTHGTKPLSQNTAKF